MPNMKPMLFNTDMVRALLDNRKTVTRRVVKSIEGYINCDCGTSFVYDSMADAFYCTGCGYPLMADRAVFLKPPYRPGDILYVRETWKQAVCDPAGGGAGLRDLYLYKADEPIDTSGMDAERKWHPSIHMPREAARIFLRVTGVRVERLWDITEEQAELEGCRKWYEGTKLESPARSEFCNVWDSTIKPADRALYGWDANPWVWVIEFERISKGEAMQYD